MKPKAEALIDFINSSDNKEISSCITSLEKEADALEGNTGTWVKKINYKTKNAHSEFFSYIIKILREKKWTITN